MRSPAALLLALLSLRLAVAPQTAESSPVVAVPPATLELRNKRSELVGAPLAERVQLALQAAQPLTEIEFVSRDALDAALREQELALAGATVGAPASSIRAGRLARADWILRLRLRADDLARPRIEADVIDALRADLLAREETPLEELPDEGWLLLPGDAATARASEVAARALRAAFAQRPIIESTRRLAPLAFVDRSPNERLSPLAPLLHAALREPRPGLRVLGYEAESEARSESALFLAGLTDLEPAAWARLADAYVWGEFTEAVGYSGPVSDLPVRALLQLWSDDRGPREIVVVGRFGDLPALAQAAAEAVRAALGPDKISDPFAQRPEVARVLRDSALEMRAKEKTYAARLATLSLFFDPLDPANHDAGRSVLADFTGPATWQPAAVSLRQALGPAASVPAAPAGAPQKKSAAPAATPPTPPVSAFIAWREQPLDRLVAAAEAGPIIGSPWLAPDWVELPPATIIPAAAREAFKDPPTALGLAAGALWLAPRPAWPSADKLPRSGLWRLPLASPLSAAEEIAAFPRVPVAVLDSVPGGSLWFATRGAGLVVLDPAQPARIEEIGVAAGLPSVDLQNLHHAPGARLTTRWRDYEGVIASVSLDGRAVAQVQPPPSEIFPNLPPALRAAIQAHGDASAPRVRLPGTPFFAYEQKPAGALAPLASRRPLPGANTRQRDPSHALSAIPTGLDDGYWTASIDTVAWAAGTRLVPLAHWLQGEIAGLADDGRHLFITVARRRELRSLHTAPPEPDTLAIHIYDYHAGRWLGRVATPWAYALHAGEGHLLLVPPTATPWRLARLSTLHAVAAPPEPAAPPPPARARLDPKQREQQRARQRVQDRLVSALNRPVADLDAVRAALADGAVAAPPDANRTQPVLEAARQRHWEAFELLFPLVPATAWNAAPVQDSIFVPPPTLGRRLVLVLLQNERPDLAARVIAAGADVGPAKDFSDESLAWLAIRCGSPELVRTLHAAGWPLGTDIMQHPLREAVAQKNAALLRELLRLAPERLEDSTGNGQTPLFAAADIGWAEGVRLLLEAGATDFFGDSIARRTLHAAASPWPEVVVLLNRRPGAADNLLAGARAVAAAISGDPALLAAVVPEPAVLRYHDFHGWTVLHHAARLGRADLVARLLAAGAPRDALTHYGESALCLAASHGDPATFFALLRAGSEVNARRDRGWSPVHAAAREGRADFVRALLAAGADLRDSVGENAEPVAVLAAGSANDETSLRLLIEAGAPLRVANAEGFGPLEAAVRSDSPAKIQCLLDHGARWQKSFDEDYHPMDDAARHGLARSIRKLRELGLASPRAASFAKDDTTRALLLADDSEAGRLLRLNEQQWRVVLAEPDSARRLERVRAHLAAGADPNHLSAEWGTPLDLAIFTQDAELVRLLVELGADPARKSSGMAAGRFVHPRTSLHRFLASRFDRVSAPPPSPPALDEFVLEMLPLFWPAERERELREDMLDWTPKGGLPRSAAWLREHLRD